MWIQFVLSVFGIMVSSLGLSTFVRFTAFLEMKWSSLATVGIGMIYIMFLIGLLWMSIGGLVVSLIGKKKSDQTFILPLWASKRLSMSDRPGVGFCTVAFEVSLFWIIMPLAIVGMLGLVGHKLWLTDWASVGSFGWFITKCVLVFAALCCIIWIIGKILTMIGRGTVGVVQSLKQTKVHAILCPKTDVPDAPPNT